MANQATKMPIPRNFSEQATQQKIAVRAYEFWLARAFREGSPAEDWLRAEREVRGKAGPARLKRTTVGIFVLS